MAVLAIEADPRQASAIRHIVCDLVKTKLTLVDSIADAVECLSTQTPDLILLPPLISPADEAELLRVLRTLPGGAHIEMHVTPMLDSPHESTRPPQRSRSSRRAAPDALSGNTDVAAFAERVSWSLERLRNEQEEEEEDRLYAAAALSSDTRGVSGATAPDTLPADGPFLIALASEAPVGSESTLQHEPPAPVAPARAERRRHVRVAGPFDGYRRGVIDTPLLIQDLSESGCFVNSVHSSEGAGELTLAILLPNDNWITVRAEIVRSSPGFGFGVRFIDVPEEARAELVLVVAEREQAAPRDSRN